MVAIADLYRHYHSSRNNERLGLFQGLVERYDVRSALYPGSFVHVTPSFVIPTVVYLDADRRADGFFRRGHAAEIVAAHKAYDDEPTLRFHSGSYEEPIDEAEASFDLLISQYAGFVSRSCTRYLRIGGHLVANNSHGDASMASLDPGYRLVAVYRRRDERFTFADTELDTYMVPKKGPPPSREELERAGRGPAFTRRVAGYVFQLVG